MWIPTILENDIDPNYSECVCPKCGETTVHHMGAPCQHYSCPICGEMMERRGVHDMEVKEGIVKLPDGSGFFTGTVGKKKKVKEDLYQVDTPKIKKVSGHILPKSPPEFGSSIPSPMAALGEAELVDTYLDFLQTEDFLGSIKRAAKRIKKAATEEKPAPYWIKAHRAYWGTPAGGKVPWPSKTGEQVADTLK